jgi:hypothetical protein
MPSFEMFSVPPPGSNFAPRPQETPVPASVFEAKMRLKGYEFVQISSLGDCYSAAAAAGFPGELGLSLEDAAHPSAQAQRKLNDWRLAGVVNAERLLEAEGDDNDETMATLSAFKVPRHWYHGESGGGASCAYQWGVAVALQRRVIISKKNANGDYAGISIIKDPGVMDGTLISSTMKLLEDVDNEEQDSAFLSYQGGHFNAWVRTSLPQIPRRASTPTESRSDAHDEQQLRSALLATSPPNTPPAAEQAAAQAEAAAATAAAEEAAEPAGAEEAAAAGAATPKEFGGARDKRVKTEAAETAGAEEAAATPNALRSDALEEQQLRAALLATSLPNTPPAAEQAAEQAAAHAEAAAATAAAEESAESAGADEAAAAGAATPKEIGGERVKRVKAVAAGSAGAEEAAAAGAASPLEFGGARVKRVKTEAADSAGADEAAAAGAASPLEFGGERVLHIKAVAAGSAGADEAAAAGAATPKEIGGARVKRVKTEAADSAGADEAAAAGAAMEVGARVKHVTFDGLGAHASPQAQALADTIDRTRREHGIVENNTPHLMLQPSHAGGWEDNGASVFLVLGTGESDRWIVGDTTYSSSALMQVDKTRDSRSKGDVVRPIMSLRMLPLLAFPDPSSEQRVQFVPMENHEEGSKRLNRLLVRSGIELAPLDACC